MRPGGGWALSWTLPSAFRSRGASSAPPGAAARASRARPSSSSSTSGLTKRSDAARSPARCRRCSPRRSRGCRRGRPPPRRARRASAAPPSLDPLSTTTTRGRGSGQPLDRVEQPRQLGLRVVDDRDDRRTRSPAGLRDDREHRARLARGRALPGEARGGLARLPRRAGRAARARARGAAAPRPARRRRPAGTRSAASPSVSSKTGRSRDDRGRAARGGLERREPEALLARGADDRERALVERVERVVGT